MRHNHSLWRLVTYAAAGVALAGILVAIPLVRPTPSQAEECLGGHGGDHAIDAGQGRDHVRDFCLTQSQIDALDDSQAQLGVDEEASSPNMRRLANVPKQGDLAGEANFNSDLAFTGHLLIDGNYNGFAVYDIRLPWRPRLVASVLCPGSQNDVSVAGNLVITSTDSRRNKAGCGADNVPVPPDETTNYWEGIRVFDISDPANPRYVTAVETQCGSHTHTTIQDPANNRALVYVQSYGPRSSLARCQPPHDKISIVEVPLAAPETASVVNTPVLFPDGGFPGIPGRTSSTSGCHDITAFPARGIAAGACMGQGVIMDIRDPVHPVVISSVTDLNFAFWHSATISNDGRTVVFTDELGGGSLPTCNPDIGPNRGADAIYDITNPAAPVFKSYFKIPRTQFNTENCVAHNGSLIPVPGRDIMVQAWYQGGISVWEFTDPANPVELAWFERGPLSMERLIGGGSWSAYWYNGFLYSSDIQKGLDVFHVNELWFVLANANRMRYFNAQTQQPFRVDFG